MRIRVYDEADEQDYVEVEVGTGDDHISISVFVKEAEVYTVRLDVGSSKALIAAIKVANDEITKDE